MNETSSFGTAIVLEDESPDLENLTAELEASGIEVSAARGMEEFIGFFYDLSDPNAPNPPSLGVCYDAAFLDWELYGAEQGGRAIELMIKGCPDAGTAVVTRHEDRSDEAFRKGADAFILKSTPPGERLAIERKCVELGKLRRLGRSVLRAGFANEVPRFPRGKLPSADVVDKFRWHANQFYDELFRTGFLETEIHEQLRALGWRAEISVSDLVATPHEQRVASICKSLGLDVTLLSRILGISDELARAVLSGRWIDMAEDLATDTELEETVDLLTSVFSFALQIARYDETLFRITWRERIIGTHTSDPPPWAGRTFEGFLSESGPRGLRQAVVWIRRT